MPDAMIMPTVAGLTAPDGSKALVSANLNVLHSLEYQKIINLLLVGALIFTGAKLIVMLFAYILKIA